MPLTLDEFERVALPTLLHYAEIECLSPDYDAAWRENGHLDAAAELLADWARQRRLGEATIEIIRLDGRTPVLFVDVAATDGGEGPTVLLYGHLDKQPPLGEWSEGLGPFTPVRRGDRVYARGVSDDGYSTFAALLALEQLVDAGVPHARCVVLIEASEESGSPDLEPYLDALAPRLGDVGLMICLDSGALTYDRLWVTTSLRGLVNVDLTVEVLSRGQHSGSASGVVPSSFRILRQLLDRVEDSATGRVLLEQFHGEIPEHVRRAAAAVAEEFGDVVGDDMPLVEGLELMGDSAAERILAQTWRPALSITGIGGVPTPDNAGNVLRPFTTASLSIRVPPNVDPVEAREALESVLTTDVPSHANVRISGVQNSPGWASPAPAPWLGAALDAASRLAFGRDAGYTGEGGSIPFLASLGRRYPGVQIVATGVLGPGSNAHGIDEMLDLPTCVSVTNAVAHVVGAFSRREEES